MVQFHFAENAISYGLIRLPLPMSYFTFIKYHLL